MVCEALTDAEDSFERSDEDKRRGMSWASNEFKVLEVLAGEPPKPTELNSYRWVDAPGRRERPIRKGERVIWMCYRVYTDGWSPQLAKAMAATPANRRAALEAVEAERVWSGPSQGLQCRLTAPKTTVAMGERMSFQLDLRFVPHAWDAPKLNLLNRSDQAEKVLITFEDAKNGRFYQVP